MPARRRVGPTEGGVKRDLKALDELQAGASKSALAQLAIAMARDVDNPDTAAYARASCARACADTMAELRDLLPKPKTGTLDDELKRKRDGRRAAAAARVADATDPPAT